MKRIAGLILIIVGLLGFAGSAFAADAVEVPALKIDTGDTAWMIVATALVMLMTRVRAA